MAGRFSNLEFQPPQEERARLAELHAGDERLDSACVARARDAEEWGRWEQALRFYTRALGEERGLVAAWVGQVQMLVQLDECHEARVWSEKALQLFRGHGDLLAAQAQAAVRLNDLSSAQKLSDAALSAADDSPWRWAVRGEVILARGQRHSDECFHKAVQHKLADWLDFVRVGRICAFHGRLANAVGYVKSALTLRPEHAYPWFALGECQARMALVPAARASFGRAVELAPRWEEPRRALDALDARGGMVGWLRGFLKGRR